MWRCILIVVLIIGLVAGLLGAVQAVNWPLRLNTSGKYIEDQSGIPFLIIGDAGWGLAVRLSQSDIITYLNDRQAKGFTAIEVRIIDHLFCDNCPNNYNGDPPFCQSSSLPCVGVHSPWTYRNEAYWKNVDYIIDQARSRGMVILGFPAYLGYQCGFTGWCADMQAQTNADMTSYGQWIGNRYKDNGNIIWMTGGDADASLYPDALARVTALVNAIRAADPDALFSAEPVRGQVAGIDSFANLLDINGVYTGGSEDIMIKKAYQQSTRPFMLQEAYYENEHGTTLLDWQSQALITHLGGGLIGQVFGSCPLWHFSWSGGVSWCDSSSYPFNTWQNSLNSPGSVSQGNIGKLMRSRKWWKFVPDYSNAVVTSSKGSGVNYHATARETNGETVMVWCPDTNVVTVDMTKIGGTQAKAWWWNPDDNTATVIGTYATNGSMSFTPGSARRLLILDSVDITSEMISAPTTLSGPLNGYTGASYKFSSGGSSSTLGSNHPVEYQFDWGDGTFSSWGSPDRRYYSQSHVWTATGTYQVKARARCANHTSVFSSWTEPLSVIVNSVPSPPTNVQASDGTYMDKVRVNWTASLGANSYTVYRARSLNRRARKTVLGMTSGTSFDDTNATPGTTYYYWVKASYSYGASNFSAYDAGYR